MEEFLSGLIKYRLPICIVFFLCFAAGLQSLSRLPIDAFPDLANNQVQVLTEAPGMACLEVEQLVTIPIESVMNGLPAVTQVRSLSKYGLSVVTVVFADHVDTYFARQLVLERLQTAKARIPGGLNPELGPISTAMGEIYQYIVQGNGYSLTDLKTLHDFQIKYQLRTVAGVAEVNSWGGFTDQYEVRLIPGRLQQYRLSLGEVFDALRKNNDNFGAGIVNHESEQYVVRGLGRASSLEDISNVIIKSDNGIPILIKNVALVSHGTALRQGAVTRNGMGEVVLGLVMMLKGQNSRDVITRVKAKIVEIGATLPAGVHLEKVYDQSKLVEQTISTVRTNLLEGGALVILVLLLTVGNIRAALIVASVIPLSMMFSFIGMRVMGVTANIMSLGAVDFGMIVDGSIVMVENILRNMGKPSNVSRTKDDIIADSMKEVLRPIVFGIAIITVVYIPILCLEGMEYKMFSPMVVTVGSALVGSLLIALLLVPTFCSFFLKRSVHDNETAVIRCARNFYAPLLDKALERKRAVVLSAACALALAVLFLALTGTEFVPRLDEGDVLIETKSFPSISLPAQIHNISKLEGLVRDMPQVKEVFSRIGRPDIGTDPMGVFAADMFVLLKPKSEWGVTKDQIIEKMRRHLNENTAGMAFNFTQPIAMRVDELVSGVRSDIAVKIFGDDMKVLQEKASEVERIISTVHGAADLQVEKLFGSAQLAVMPDRARMARYAVSVADIKALLQTAIIGTPVSQIVDGRKRFDLCVKFPEGQRIEPAQLGDMLVETASGMRVPLGQIARVETQDSYESINREFGQRRIVVQCNVRHRDIGGFVQECREKINSAVRLDPGYYITWGGQFENQQRAARKFMWVVPLSVLVIFFFLVATFASVKHALLVLLNVPFALIGGVFALWLRGLYLSVPAAIGFIALFGVAVLNGLVLVSYINKLCEQGNDVVEAVRRGAQTRLRPVLITALVASLGFLPMALSEGSGAEVQRPLATVVIGGLFSSTLLTLFVLPVLYCWLFGKRGRIV